MACPECHMAPYAVNRFKRLNNIVPNFHSFTVYRDQCLKHFFSFNFLLIDNYTV